jgi:hypothetical protein
VKAVSTRELLQLAAEAKAAVGVSAIGRPAWLENHKSEIERVYLTAQIVESREVLRCLVTIMLSTSEMGAFTLDVATRRFERLRTISTTEVVELLHDLLSRAAWIPLDTKD